MFKRAFLVYCLTIVIFACIIFVPQFKASENDDGATLGALVIVLSVLGMGLIAALPTLASWMPIWAMLGRLHIDARWRAVIAAGPTAFIAAFCVDYLFREIDTGFGQVGVPPNIQEIMMVVAVAILTAFLVWTVLPEKGVQK